MISQRDQLPLGKTDASRCPNDFSVADTRFQVHLPLNFRASNCVGVSHQRLLYRCRRSSDPVDAVLFFFFVCVCVRLEIDKGSQAFEAHKPVLHRTIGGFGS